MRAVLKCPGRRTRTIVVLAFVSCTFVATSPGGLRSTAAAQPSSQPQPSFSITPESGTPGSTVTINTLGLEGYQCGALVFRSVGSPDEGTVVSSSESGIYEALVPRTLGSGPAVAVSTGIYQLAVSCTLPGQAFGSFETATDPFVITSTLDPPSRFVAIAAQPGGGGYWLAERNGGIFSFGTAQFEGSLPGMGVIPNAPVVGMASTLDGKGYWLVGADGGVFSFGDAGYHGSILDLKLSLAEPIVGVTATPDGRGYWLAGADGGVFSFGDARYCTPPQLPILDPAVPVGFVAGDVPTIGIAGSPNSIGYETVDSFGNGIAAPAPGGTCNSRVLDQNFALVQIIGTARGLFAPVSGIASVNATASTWEVGRDGGVFGPTLSPIPGTSSLPSAPFYGSLPELGIKPAAPIVGIAATVDGGGYWLVGEDGGVFSFGDARFYGSAAGLAPW